MSSDIELHRLDDVSTLEENYDNLPPKPCCGHDEYEEVRLRKKVHALDIEQSPLLLVLFYLWVSPLLDLSKYVIHPFEVPHGQKRVTLDVIMPRFFTNWTKSLNKAYKQFQSSKGIIGPDSHKQKVKVDGKQIVNDLPAPTDELGIPLSELPTIFWVITKAFPSETILSAIFEVFLYVFNTCIPYAIAGLTDFFEDSDDGVDVNIGHGFGYATALAVICVAVASSSTIRFFFSINLGVQFRSAIATTVVEKSLRVAPAALGPGYSTGTTLNMISNDSQRFFDCIMWLHCLWSSPLMITVCIILLYFELGIAALATIGLMVLLFPFQLAMAHIIKHYKTLAIKKTDERVKLVSELIQGVRIIKLYAWEDAMSQRLSHLRADELSLIQRTLILKTVNEIILFIWPLVVTYATVSIYSVISDDLNQKKVFMLLAFLNAMRYPISLLPTAISSTVEMLVANRRISEYLNKEELSLRKPGPSLPPSRSPFLDYDDSSTDDDDDNDHDGDNNGKRHDTKGKEPSMQQLTIATTPIDDVMTSTMTTEAGGNHVRNNHPNHNKRHHHHHHHDGPDAPLSFAATARSSSVKPTDASPIAIMVNHCDFYWASFHAHPDQYPVLTDINLRIPHGSLCGIIGTVGIGKTALITGILGELYINQRPPHLRIHSTHDLPTLATTSTTTTTGAAIDKTKGTPSEEVDTTVDPNVVYGSFSYTGNNTTIPHDLICIRGRVGYCAQDPWLLNGTLRENITLGLDSGSFDEDKFNKVVDAAALASDIKILSQGADTPVGDSGISLSGGQRARCAFARLLYRADELDVVFLDDIFAAVDVAVAKTMFFKGVCGILAEKTVVMTLNSHFNFLAHCDCVISLDYVSEQVMHEQFIAPRENPQGNDSPSSSPPPPPPPPQDGSRDGDSMEPTETSNATPRFAHTSSDVAHEIKHYEQHGGNPPGHSNGNSHPSKHHAKPTHQLPNGGGDAVIEMHELRGSRRPATINKMGTFFELLEAKLHVLSTFDINRVFSGIPSEHKPAIEPYHCLKTDPEGDQQMTGDHSHGNKSLTDLTLATHHHIDDIGSLSGSAGGITTPAALSNVSTSLTLPNVMGDQPDTSIRSPTTSPTSIDGLKPNVIGGESDTTQNNLIPAPPSATTAASTLAEKAMLERDHNDSDGTALDYGGLTHSDSMDVVQFELSRRGSIDRGNPPSFHGLSLQQQQQYHEQQQQQQQQQQQEKGQTNDASDGQQQQQQQQGRPPSASVTTAQPPGGLSLDNRPRTMSIAEHTRLSAIAEQRKLPIILTGPAIQANVDKKYYLQYIQGSKGVFLLYVTIFLILLAAIGSQFFRVAGDYWITLWSRDSPYTPASDHTQYHWRVTSGCLVAICFVFLVFRTIVLIFVYIDASQYLHDTTFTSVMGAPMYWFDTTLIGNILNRFSKDMDQIDTILPDNMDRFIQQFLILIGIVVMACISSYYFLIAMLPLLYALYLFRRSFTRTSVQLKRLENSSMSPVYSSFQTILNGAQTIRAYHLQHYFLSIHRKLVDNNGRITLIFNYLQRRLAFLLNSLAGLFVLLIGYLIVIFRESINTQVSILAVTMSMQLVGLLQTTVRIHTVLESCMTSVERLDQYTKIPQEGIYTTPKDVIESRILPAYRQAGLLEGGEDESTARIGSGSAGGNSDNNDGSVAMATPHHASHHDGNSRIGSTTASRRKSLADPEKPKSSVELRLQGWPWRGEIAFNHVCMAYRPDLPLVLNNLTLSIPSGKKVGVIGRTGAGKSSLLLALFRMVELSSGSITIDGVDIAQLGLGDLRSRLSIITQQPTLFSGTVRSNLDPFDLYDDEAITTALKYAHIYDKVQSMSHGIHSSVGEGGGNFSQAERQLLCIARSLLLNNKIIVLDEATASVDPAADEAIQTTIRSAFAECTIITIAHRLETIADFDYVLVLQPVGQVKQPSADEPTESSHGKEDDDNNDEQEEGADEGDSSQQKVHTELNDSLLEFDAPYKLLTDKNSYFYKMATEGGEVVYQHLLAKAKSAYLKSHPNADIA